MIYCMSFVVLGSALICDVCYYTTEMPKALQKCTGRTINCTKHSNYNSYCLTNSVTYRNGTEAVTRVCARNGVCPGNACTNLTKVHDLKWCATECCNTDNCNNYTLSSATAVMVTKFTLSLMVIVGLIFA